jgi:hypothetical protein
MTYRISIAAFVVALAMCAGCSKDREVTSAAPAPPPWEGEVRAREAQIDKVIADNRQSFDAFDSGSLGDASCRCSRPETHEQDAARPQPATV